jgi:hypothetical protein
MQSSFSPGATARPDTPAYLGHRGDKEQCQRERNARYYFDQIAFSLFLGI